MGKAVFFNIPAHGHVNPTLPAVRELVRRGESIIYYGLDEFRQVIEATGASFRAYGDLSESVRFDFGTTDRRYANLWGLAEVMMEFCERSLPFLVEATARDAPDYILHDFTCIWGKYVSQILCIPAITTIPQFPVNMKRRPEPYPGMFGDTLRMLATGIPSLIRFWRIGKRISEAHSVERLGVLDMLASHEDLNIVFTSRYFQPYADDFDESFEFVGPSIAARDETLDFSMDHGSGPLVYISLGTVFNVNPAFYGQCVEAFRDTDRRVVLSVGAQVDVDRLPQIPDNFVVRNYVPQLQILREADVFITHGGMNSVSEGLWYGVPLVVIPQAADQFFVAQRVEALQAGAVLYNRDVSPAALRSIVDRAISDETLRANSARIGESFREAGGYERAADVILRATSPDVRPNRTGAQASS